jgi:hypothetical protein
VSGLTAVKARPAYPYRPPDCRIDEGDWSMSYKWESWVEVEKINANAACLGRFAQARRD